jgi:hypothetical protein
MTDKSKATQNNTSVKDYIASLNDDQIAKGSHVLIEMMQRISGREGDGHIIGFYPRKGKITVYLMDGTQLWIAG